MSKAVGVADIDKSLEMEIARSLHQSKGAAAELHPASAEQETTADKLSKLFGRLTKLSMNEVDSLIDELHRLRTKLKIDNDLVFRVRWVRHGSGAFRLIETSRNLHF